MESEVQAKPGSAAAPGIARVPEVADPLVAELRGEQIRGDFALGKDQADIKDATVKRALPKEYRVLVGETAVVLGRLNPHREDDKLELYRIDRDSPVSLELTQRKVPRKESLIRGGKSMLLAIVVTAGTVLFLDRVYGVSIAWAVLSFIYIFLPVHERRIEVVGADGTFVIKRKDMVTTRFLENLDACIASLAELAREEGLSDKIRMT